MATGTQERLPLQTKLLFGFGTIAYGIKENGFSTLLLLYYNQVIGIPAFQVGLVIMVALMVDALADPLIGHYSDHLRSRWGRRHPLMYGSAVPASLLYLALWNPPQHLGTGMLLGWLLLFAIAVRAAIACYEIPSAALVPELTRDYHERTSVLGYRTLFGWLGGTLMLLVTFGVLLRPTAEYPVGQLNPAGYRSYAIVAAFLILFPILISAFSTHRFIPRLAVPSGARETLGQTIRKIYGTLRNRAFLTLILAGTCVYTIQGLNFALSTYFNTYLWGFSAHTIALYTIFILLGVIVALVIANLASRAWGKRAAAAGSSILFTIFAVTPLLLRMVGLFPGNESPSLLPLVMGATLLMVSFGVSGTLLTMSMMAEVVEQEQERSGERTEGIYYAGNFFMQKCVTGIGLAISGALLSLAAFPANAVPGQVPEAVMDRLILGYAAIVIVCGIAGALIIRRFPITEADHRARLARLAAQPS